MQRWSTCTSAREEGFVQPMHDYVSRESGGEEKTAVLEVRGFLEVVNARGATPWLRQLRSEPLGKLGRGVSRNGALLNRSSSEIASLRSMRLPSFDRIASEQELRKTIEEKAAPPQKGTTQDTHGLQRRPSITKTQDAKTVVSRKKSLAGKRPPPETPKVLTKPKAAGDNQGKVGGKTPEGKRSDVAAKSPPHVEDTSRGKVGQPPLQKVSKSKSATVEAKHVLKKPLLASPSKPSVTSLKPQLMLPKKVMIKHDALKKSASPKKSAHAEEHAGLKSGILQKPKLKFPGKAAVGPPPLVAKKKGYALSTKKSYDQQVKEGVKSAVSDKSVLSLAKETEMSQPPESPKPPVVRKQFSSPKRLTAAGRAKETISASPPRKKSMALSKTEDDVTPQISPKRPLRRATVPKVKQDSYDAIKRDGDSTVIVKHLEAAPTATTKTSQPSPRKTVKRQASPKRVPTSLKTPAERRSSALRAGKASVGFGTTDSTKGATVKVTDSMSETHEATKTRGRSPIRPRFKTAAKRATSELTAVAGLKNTDSIRVTKRSVSATLNLRRLTAQSRGGTTKFSTQRPFVPTKKSLQKKAQSVPSTKMSPSQAVKKPGSPISRKSPLPLGKTQPPALTTGGFEQQQPAVPAVSYSKGIREMVEPKIQDAPAPPGDTSPPSKVSSDLVIVREPMALLVSLEDARRSKAESDVQTHPPIQEASVLHESSPRLSRHETADLDQFSRLPSSIEPDLPPPAPRPVRELLPHPKWLSASIPPGAFPWELMSQYVATLGYDPVRAVPQTRVVYVQAPPPVKESLSSERTERRHTRRRPAPATSREPSPQEDHPKKSPPPPSPLIISSPCFAACCQPPTLP